MSDDFAILLERHGHVAVLTINRPHTRNGLSGEDVFAAFESRFAKLNADQGMCRGWRSRQQTADHHEAVNAFFEKRVPQFTGQ